MAHPSNRAWPENLVKNIETFFEKVHPNLEIGKNLYSELFQYFFPLQRRGELECMMEVARSIKPKTIMEIGIANGGGFYHWCKGLPSVKNLIGCEIRDIPYKHCFEKGFPEHNFHWIEGSSHDKKNQNGLKKWLNGTPIDILFIDGDKAHFLQDFMDFYPLMNPNGIVFMHDVTTKDPGKAFGEVSKKFFTMKLIDTRESVLVQIHPENFSEQGELVETFKGTKISGYTQWLRHWQGRSAGVGVIFLSRPKK